jgi:hypothetical protein
MNKFILFENKGELEERAVFMMGASPKRGDSTKIGRFGSGFKYALAKIMREDVIIRIFSGENLISVDTQEFTLRDKTFKAITINGKETSLTTDMGPDWKWWQTIRELWCNALDEGEADFRKDIEGGNIQGIPGYTRIYLEATKDVQDVVDNWSGYFASDREDILVDQPEIKVYRAVDGRQLYYRRGIKCHSSEKAALYHYDCKDFEINEERVINNDYSARWLIRRLIAKHATAEIAHAIIKRSYVDKTIENDFDFEGQTLSQVWIDTANSFKSIVLGSVSGHYLTTIEVSGDNYALVNEGLAKALFNAGVKVYGLTTEGKKQEWVDVKQPSRKQTFLMNETVKALENELGYPIKYPMRIVDFEDTDVMGKAEMGSKTILISSKLFEKGKREIALVIIEEQEHLDTKFGDTSRDLQNHLFNKYLSALEDKAAYFL